MNAREIKNQLVIDGTIDAAFKTLLECQEPDAWRAALIELAHAAVDSAMAAECERWRELVEQLIACHEEPSCPAVEMARELLTANRLLPRL